MRGVVWPGESVYPDFTDPRVRKWWGGLYAERLAQGFAGVLARHERAGVVRRLRRADAAALGPARAGGPGRRPPGGAQRLRPGDGAGRLRGAARTAAGRAAVPVLPLGLGGDAALRGQRGPGDVATGWPGLRASLSLVLGLGLCGVPYSGPDVGGFTGSPSPGAVSAVVPAGRVSAAVPYAFGDRRRGGGSRGSSGPRCCEHARGGAARTAAAAAVLRDAGAAGAAAPGRRTCGRCGGATPRGPGAAGLRGRLPAGGRAAGGAGAGAGARSGGRCGCRAAAGTTRRPAQAYEGPGQVLAGRAAVADPGAGAGGGGAAGDGGGRRAGAGGVGAGGRAYRGRAGGAGRGGRLGRSREVERFTARLAGGRVVVERDGTGGGRAGTRCGCAGWRRALRQTVRRSGPRTRGGRPAVCSGKASSAGRCSRLPAVGLVGGRGRRQFGGGAWRAAARRGAGAPSGRAEGVGEPHVVGWSASMPVSSREFADDGVLPVLAVVDEAAGQGEAAARGARWCGVMTTRAVPSAVGTRAAGRRRPAAGCGRRRRRRRGRSGASPAIRRRVRRAAGGQWESLSDRARRAVLHWSGADTGGLYPIASPPALRRLLDDPVMTRTRSACRARWLAAAAAACWPSPVASAPATGARPSRRPRRSSSRSRRRPDDPPGDPLPHPAQLRRRTGRRLPRSRCAS